MCEKDKKSEKNDFLAVFLDRFVYGYTEVLGDMVGILCLCLSFILLLKKLLGS